MDSEDVVHIYNGIRHSQKKEQNNTICSNLDATELFILSEISQKDKYQDITYILSLKYGKNESTFKTDTENRHREKTCGFQEGRRQEWHGLGVWVSR